MLHSINQDLDKNTNIEPLISELNKLKQSIILTIKNKLAYTEYCFNNLFPVNNLLYITSYMLQFDNCLELTEILFNSFKDSCNDASIINELAGRLQELQLRQRDLKAAADRFQLALNKKFNQKFFTPTPSKRPREYNLRKYRPSKHLLCYKHSQ